MTDLQTIIARLEAATGPDRTLDAEIAVALQLGCRKNLPGDHEYLQKVSKGDECAEGTYWFVCRSGMSLRTSLLYGASIDAALTLVDAEDSWRVGHDGTGADPSLFKAEVLGWTGEDSEFFEGVSEVPAIALCIAALRAKAAQKGEGA